MSRWAVTEAGQIRISRWPMDKAREIEARNAEELAALLRANPADGELLRLAEHHEERLRMIGPRCQHHLGRSEHREHGHEDSSGFLAVAALQVQEMLEALAGVRPKDMPPLPKPGVSRKAKRVVAALQALLSGAA